MNKANNQHTARPIKTIITLSFLAALAFAAQAHASPHGHGSLDWAKVTQVEAVYRDVERREPDEHCWYEQNNYSDFDYTDKSYTSTIMGGIIGGAIGNAVGHKKKNKRIGTAVGAILGASIGHDIGERQGNRSLGAQTHTSKKRCERSYRVVNEREHVGYDVWYRYHGQVYKTHMKHHPGKRIRVRVSVDPV